MSSWSRFSGGVLCFTYSDHVQLPQFYGKGKFVDILGMLDDNTTFNTTESFPNQNICSSRGPLCRQNEIHPNCSGTDHLAIGIPLNATHGVGSIGVLTIWIGGGVDRGQKICLTGHVTSARWTSYSDVIRSDCLHIKNPERSKWIARKDLLRKIGPRVFWFHTPPRCCWSQQWYQSIWALLGWHVDSELMWLYTYGWCFIRNVKLESPAK